MNEVEKKKWDYCLKFDTSTLILFDGNNSQIYLLNDKSLRRGKKMDIVWGFGFKKRERWKLESFWLFIETKTKILKINLRSFIGYCQIPKYYKNRQIKMWDDKLWFCFLLYDWQRERVMQTDW